MITTPKMLGLLAVAFVAGSFVASPELRAYAAATIGSAEIIDGSIQSIDIGTSQVKAADIAPDAVGGSEIIGVTKLLFGQCVLTDTEKTTMVNGGSLLLVLCNINGVDTDDSAIATLNDGAGGCFVINTTDVGVGNVLLRIRNNCSFAAPIGTSTQPIGILVFDK